MKKIAIIRFTVNRGELEDWSHLVQRKGLGRVGRVADSNTYLLQCLWTKVQM